MPKQRLTSHWIKSAVWLMFSMALPGPLLAQLVWSGASGTNLKLSTPADWLLGTATSSSPTTFLEFNGAGTSFLPEVDIPSTLNRLDIDNPGA